MKKYGKYVSRVWKWFSQCKNLVEFSFFHFHFSLSVVFSGSKSLRSTCARRIAQFFTLVTAAKYLNFETYSISTVFRAVFWCFLCVTLLAVLCVTLWPWVLFYWCTEWVWSKTWNEFDLRILFASSLEEFDFTFVKCISCFLFVAGNSFSSRFIVMKSESSEVNGSMVESLIWIQHLFGYMMNWWIFYTF